MTDLPFDDWPTTGAIAAGPAHTHAIGVITLLYNDLEYGMSFLMDAYLTPGSPSVTEAIFHRLTNRSRIDVLREMVTHEADPAVRDLSLFAILCFEICTENRNTIMHMSHSWSEWNNRTILLGMKHNSDKSKVISFRLSVDDLRKVADSMLETKRFIRFLTMRLDRRHSGKDRDDSVGDLRAAWPEKPQKPNKLIPHQPDPAP